MLFESDGVRIVRGHALQDGGAADIQLVAAGSAFVGAHFARDYQRRFLGQVLNRLEQLGRNLVFGDDALND